MEFVLRLGSGKAANYPLPLHAPADWQQTAEGWLLDIPLPVIPKKHIIIPSFAMLGQEYAYQFSLMETQTPPPRGTDKQGTDKWGTDKRVTALMWVPPRKAVDASINATFSAQIDCWHSQRDSQATVRIVMQSAAQPCDELVTLSIRPLVKECLPQGDIDTKITQLRPISQMMAPKSMARGVCSPTALSMAIGTCWPQTIRACYDPQTRAYGCWPLAIHWASVCGKLAAVEALHNWQDICAVLNQGCPMVCSINFKSGDLTDAPSPQTLGHLVTLYGISDSKALVMDPAAPDHESVARGYDLRQFANAWLRDRGATYIFSA